MPLKKIHEAVKEECDKKLAHAKELKLQLSSMEIGDIRKKMNMTQRSFAKVLGVSSRTVEAWEIGKCNPSPTAIKLMYLLKLNPALVKDLSRMEEEEHR